MSVVDFLENNEFYANERKVLGTWNNTGATAFLVRLGVANSTKSANRLLLLVTAISILLTTWVVWSFDSENDYTFYDQSGKEYSLEEQLRAVKSGPKTFNDFRQ